MKNEKNTISTYFLQQCCTDSTTERWIFLIVPYAGMTLSEPTGKAVTAVYQSNANYDKTPTMGLDERTMYATTSNSAIRKSGFAVGVDAQYQLEKNLGVVCGIKFAQLRSSIETDENSDFTIVDLTNTSTYLQVPVLAKIYLHKGLAIQCGLQFDWSLRSNSDLTYNFYGNRCKGGDRSSFVTVGERSYHVNAYTPHMDGIQPFELALPMGISYEYHNLIAEASYSIALTPSAKAEYGHKESNDYRNSTFMFTLGYRFNLLK